MGYCPICSQTRFERTRLLRFDVRSDLHLVANKLKIGGTPMKFLAVIGIAIAASAFGQTSDKDNTKAGGVESSVTQIEQDLVKALIAGDASMFDRYLADTYIFTAPDGMVSDKAQTIADIKSGDLKFQSSKLADMKLNFMGIRR
jgi:hypothetical protein